MHNLDGQECNKTFRKETKGLGKNYISSRVQLIL